MKYYKYPDENSIEGGITYVEVDEGWPSRQLTIGNGHSLASNINHPELGFNLGEVCVDFFDDTDEVISIEKEEFDAVWRVHLAQHSPQWEAAKVQNQLGRTVVGSMIIFNPQGVLVDLGPDVVGIADYAQSLASGRSEWMHAKRKLKAIVAGYDEENQWIRLQEPQVLGE